MSEVELCQSQQYVPLSSFVFSIERKDTIVMGGGSNDIMFL